MTDRVRLTALWLVQIFAGVAFWLALGLVADDGAMSRRAAAALFLVATVWLGLSLARHVDVRSTSPIGPLFRFVVLEAAVIFGLVGFLSLGALAVSVPGIWAAGLPWIVEGSITAALAAAGIVGVASSVAALRGRQWGGLGLLVAWAALMCCTLWATYSNGHAYSVAYGLYAGGSTLVLAAVVRRRWTFGREGSSPVGDNCPTSASS